MTIELDTKDAEWINVTGNYWRGKAAVYKCHPRPIVTRCRL